MALLLAPEYPAEPSHTEGKIPSFARLPALYHSFSRCQFHNPRLSPCLGLNLLRVQETDNAP